MAGMQMGEIEKDPYLAVKKRAADAIKYGEEILCRFARARGLNENEIKSLQMEFLGKNDLTGCVNFIKSAGAKPMEPVEIFEMIEEKGLTKEVRQEIEKYLSSL